MAKITRHFDSHWMFRYDDGTDAFMVTCHSPELTMLIHENFTQMFSFGSNRDEMTLRDLLKLCKSRESILKSAQVMREPLYDREKLFKDFDKMASEKKISDSTSTKLKLIFEEIEVAETARRQLRLNGLESLEERVAEIVNPKLVLSVDLMLKFAEAIPEFLEEEKKKGEDPCIQSTSTEGA